MKQMITKIKYCSDCKKPITAKYKQLCPICRKKHRAKNYQKKDAVRAFLSGTNLQKSDLSQQLVDALCIKREIYKLSSKVLLKRKKKREYCKRPHVQERLSAYRRSKRGKEARKRFFEKNPNYQKEYNKKYYERNPDYSRKYYLKNKKKKAAYYQQNKEKIIAYMKKRYREKIRNIAPEELKLKQVKEAQHKLGKLISVIATRKGK